MIKETDIFILKFWFTLLQDKFTLLKVCHESQIKKNLGI